MEHTIVVTMEKKYTSNDLVNILSCITADCIWCSDIEYADNDYAKAKKRLADRGNNNVCYEEVLVEILEMGKTIWFCDDEMGEVYDLTLDKLLCGIQMNCEYRPSDCDIDDGDAETMDCIIQYALFGEILFS